MNKVLLLGHVGKDGATIRYTQSGAAVANFSLATKERGRDGGPDVTDWHKVVCFGKTADTAGKYCPQGKQVLVEGKLTTRNWVDPKGVKHYVTEVVAFRLELLGGGKRDDEQRGETASAATDYDDFDIGDLGPPLDMDDKPLSPGD